jgi:hypothetical protein
MSQTQTGLEEIDAEAVFVGHGITAPEFGWDDYQGVDVKGKAVVLFTNEPPSDDPTFFGGKALTYYGRWTYKRGSAADLGARGRVPPGARTERGEVGRTIPAAARERASR